MLEPPTYLEIGIRHGDSLALARGTSIGIDPAYELRTELSDDATLFRETSDEYFGRPDPLAALGGRTPGLAFIDGMHLVEFALRDFINVERCSGWTTAVIFDDIFPADVEMAARQRQTILWSGDVYKILSILDRHRPVQPDPQRVPADVLERRGALDPEAVLEAPFWSLLKHAREQEVDRRRGLRELRRSVP